MKPLERHGDAKLRFYVYMLLSCMMVYHRTSAYLCVIFCMIQYDNEHHYLIRIHSECDMIWYFGFGMTWPWMWYDTIWFDDYTKFPFGNRFPLDSCNLCRWKPSTIHGLQGPAVHLIKSVPWMKLRGVGWGWTWMNPLSLGRFKHFVKDWLVFIHLCCPSLAFGSFDP